MKTAIVSASRDESYDSSLLKQSLLTIQEYARHKGAVLDDYNYPSNKDGLSTVYNDFLDKKGSEYECVIFVHDDLYIDDLLMTDKIRDGFEKYDIIGLAGGKNPIIVAPALWHIMCKPDTHRGCVGHFHPSMEVVHYTSFGPVPDRVSVIDGLFMAVNIQKITEVNWRFDTEFSFHHYDIASCLSANEKRLKIGVLPIYTIHKSPGLMNINDPVFQASQSMFLHKFNK